MTPLFSVIIPVFNRAHLLERALQSVLAQDFQDFEIVVVDDGSGDDPQAVVAAIGDPRIRLVRQNNQGGGAARNRGLDLAKGHYVAFLDSDDHFLPHHLRMMKAMLDENPGCAAYARILMERSGRTILKPPRAIYPSEHMADYLLRDRGFVPTITLALETEIARRVRYDERLRYAQDTDFAIRLYLAGCRFVMAEEPGAVCDDRPDPGRVSQGRKGALLSAWIETMQPRISARAYHGCRGWIIAKGIAPSRPLKAFALYLNALLRGCYSLRFALVVFAQVFLPGDVYRRMADRAIALLFKGRFRPAWAHGFQREDTPFS